MDVLVLGDILIRKPALPEEARGTVSREHAR
jgi:hypothetical protein